MAEDPKLKEAKKLLEQIQKVYDELGKTNPFRGIDPDTIAASNKEIEKLKIALTGITKKADDLEAGFGGIATSIGASLAEMNKQSTATNRTVKAMRGLLSISESLKNDQSGLVELSLKELENKRDKAKILSEEAKSQAALVKQKYSEITLGKNGKQIHGAALTNRLKKQGILKSELQTIQEIIAAHEEEFDVLDKLNAKIEERIQKEKKVNKTLGLTKVALAGLGKIPIVGPLLKTNEALDAARKKAKAGGNAFQSMGAAMGSMGKSLVSSLGDPLAMIGLLVTAFKGLIELGFKFDKQVTALQKTLYLSRTEAEGMHKEFIYMQRSQTQLVDGYYTQLSTLQNQTDAANQLGTAFGVVTRVTNKEIQNQIKLTQQLGLSVEESNNLYVLARQNNLYQDDITKEISSQVTSYKKQSGVLLDSKKIHQDVSKIQGQLRLQYGNNVKQLVAATIQANKFGFSLEQTKKIAEGLLNFEQSIENELSAELLLGREINLEQARLLALNGESAKATALIAENMGGSAGFTALNVVQQDALAKALNMTSDELANSMMYQENLAKLSVDDKKRLEDKLAYYESIGEVEKAQQLERAVANEGNIGAALAALDAEKKFQTTVESIKESIGAIAAGPAMKLVNALSEMLISGTGLYDILGGIAIILTTMSVKTLVIGLIQASVAAGTMAASAAFGMSALTLGAAAAIALYGGYAIMSGINSAAAQSEARATKKVTPSFEDGGVVSGPTMGLMGEYPGAKSNPEVIAPLDKLKKIIRDDKDKDNNNQNSPSLITAINNLASRPIHVSVQMDGKKVITGLAEFKNTQGDANRIDDFEIS